MQQQWTIWLWALVSLLFAYVSYKAAVYTGDVLSPQGCRMSYMYPEYILQPGFNTSWTPLANRYSLWLYREGDGWDSHRKLTGSPVLFIPGNAGSSRQARSIASSAARQYFSDRGGIVSHEFKGRQLKPLDVFTVDFNEDFSALHEPTLLAQREYVLDAITYILSLYPPGDRIFLVGHSMGGVVSTSVLPHPHISGVITLSTPHAFPPARYSSGMDKFYHKTYQALLPPNVTTSIISICGGATDLMIPSESCMLPNWPNSSDRNRKALFSSAMEGCWTGVGHQVSVWCHQVRWRVARAILEAQSKASDTESFETMGHWLNDGVHSADMRVQRLDSPIEWGIRPSSDLFIQRVESGSKGYLLPIPTDAEAFTLLVSAGKIFNQGSIDSHEVNIELFLCFGSQDAPECSTVENPQVSITPAIHVNQEFPLPGEGVHESNGISALELPLPQTTTPRYIGILIHSKGVSPQSQSWVKAAFGRTPSLEFHFNWRTLFSTRLDIPMSTEHPLISHLKIRGLLQSSLIVYRIEGAVEVSRHIEGPELFPSITHHSASERHVYPFNSPHLLLHTHSWGPYLPIDKQQTALHLDVLSPGRFKPKTLILTLEIYSTLGRIALRFFPAVASWAIGVVGFVLLHGWSTWQALGYFPSFESSLWNFLRMEAKWVSLALLVLSVFPTPEFVLLGNQGVIGLAPIAPFAFIVACGMVCFSWIMLNMILGSARFLHSWILSQRFDNTASGQQRSLRQSSLHLCLISALIVFLIPYQVVFLICFMIQWVTCCGNDKSKEEASPTQEFSKRGKSDAFNQNTHILMLLLWLLPNMAPSLAVWVRTMATTGSVSLFNSDHSPLPVIPFLVVVELANARAPSPPFAPSHRRLQNALIKVSLYALPAVSLLIGPRYPYHAFDAAAIAFLLLSTHAI